MSAALNIRAPELYARLNLIHTALGVLKVKADKVEGIMGCKARVHMRIAYSQITLAYSIWHEARVPDSAVDFHLEHAQKSLREVQAIAKEHAR